MLPAGANNDGAKPIEVGSAEGGATPSDRTAFIGGDAAFCTFYCPKFERVRVATVNMPEAR